MSLLFMLVGLSLAFADSEGYVSNRYFFIAVGILGWFIGNKLVELEERIGDLEKPTTEAEETGSTNPPIDGSSP